MLHRPCRIRQVGDLPRLPPRRHGQVEGSSKEILDPIAADDDAFSSELDVYFERRSFATADGSVVVAALRDAYAAVVGGVQGAGMSGAVNAGAGGAVSAEHAGAEATVRGEQFWTDCALLAAEGIDAVLFGPAGEGAHAAVEWVDFDSLERTTRAIEGTVARLVV